MASRTRGCGRTLVCCISLLVTAWVQAVVGARSAACAVCHPMIYESFRRTPMAASSGEAGRAAPVETFTRASFTHSPSGFRYQVTWSGGRYWVEFEKTRDANVRGHKPLA